MNDVRWIQRFQNYTKALESLKRAQALAQSRPLSELENQGVIQGFEFTHELSWNVLKDYLTEQGIMGIIGSKNATREAFSNGLLHDGEVWMDMIRSRNLTSHTYNVEIAETVAEKVLNEYMQAFLRLEKTFTTLQQKESAPT